MRTPARYCVSADAPDNTKAHAKKKMTDKQFATVNNRVLDIEGSFHCATAIVAKKAIRVRKASFTKVPCMGDTSAGVKAMPAKQIAAVAPNTNKSARNSADFKREYA